MGNNLIIPCEVLIPLTTFSSTKRGKFYDDGKEIKYKNLIFFFKFLVIRKNYSAAHIYLFRQSIRQRTKYILYAICQKMALGVEDTRSCS